MEDFFPFTRTGSLLPGLLPEPELDLSMLGQADLSIEEELMSAPAEEELARVRSELELEPGSAVVELGCDLVEPAL